MNIYPKKFTKKFTKKFGYTFISFFINQKTRNPMSTEVSRVSDNAIYDDGTMVPIGEMCEFVRIDPTKHEYTQFHTGPFESGKLLQNKSLMGGDGYDRFSYPVCEVELANGEIVKSNFNSTSNVMMPELLFKVIPKPTDDVFAPKGVPAAAPPQADEQLQEQEQQQLQEQEQQLQEQEQQLQEEPEAKRRKCSEEATFLNAVPSDCIQPGPRPEFHNYMEAAIELPVKMVSEAGAEMAGDALKATGNKVLVDIATKKALGIEDAELLNTMSKDPKVAAELKKFETNMSRVVENSINNLGNTLIKPAEEAAEKITTGIVTAGTSTLASVTGPLVPLATIAGTVGEIVNDATTMQKAVEDATKPVNLAMQQVTGVTQALDEAQKNAAAAAASGVAGATNAVNDAAASGVSNATNAAASGVAGATNVVASGVAGATSGVASGVAGATSGVASGVAAETEIGNKRGREGGGSRKRRRIAKLSRRIERTLRRVQKKHGLRDDKNSFLRRTLNAKKMK
jgi:hypothetical protein